MVNEECGRMVKRTNAEYRMQNAECRMLNADRLLGDKGGRRSKKSRMQLISCGDDKKLNTTIS
jgi:hypothetical protein